MNVVTLKSVYTLHGPMLVLPHDAYIGRSLDKLGEFSVGEHDCFGWASRGGVALDVGANIGAHSIFLAKKYRRVYCFEPQEFIYRLLVANLATATNTTSYHAAVGSSEGIIQMPLLDYSVPNNFGGLGQDEYAAAIAAKIPLVTVPVELKMLDKVEAIQKKSQIDLIKVDVEGMEKQILEGAQATIRLHRPLLYVENDRPRKSADLLRFIYNLGYKAFWHITPLYRRNNCNRNSDDIFPGIVSFNLVCIPNERNVIIENPVPATPDSPNPPKGCVMSIAAWAASDN